jgi:hypothetical protein
MPAALFCRAMLSVSTNCLISTRTAYYGTRRIAPAAATSRSEAWGARPAVEELRPARRSSESQPAPAARHARIPVATFVTQVLAQYEKREHEIRDVAKAYANIDGLAYQLPKTVITSL